MGPERGDVNPIIALRERPLHEGKLRNRKLPTGGAYPTQRLLVKHGGGTRKPIHPRLKGEAGKDVQHGPYPLVRSTRDEPTDSLIPRIVDRGKTCHDRLSSNKEPRPLVFRYRKPNSLTHTFQDVASKRRNAINWQTGDGELSQNTGLARGQRWRASPDFTSVGGATGISLQVHKLLRIGVSATMSKH